LASACILVITVFAFVEEVKYLEAKYLNSTSNANSVLSKMQTEAKADVGSVYCYDTTNVSRIFSSSLTYNKGGAAIRVLHYLLGDSTFFNLCNIYQTRYTNKNASTKDFNQLVNELSGKNFDYFFNQWIYGKGFPNYTVKWNNWNGKLYISIEQRNSQESNNLFNLPLPFVISSIRGDSTIYLNQSTPNSIFSIPVAEPISNVAFDPENWILKTSSISKDANLNSIGSLVPKSSLKIFPNPANDFIELEFGLKEEYEIKIYNLEGRTCIHNQHNFGERINVSILPEGLYLVELIANNRARTTNYLLIKR
jgi:hypothetical protein